MLTASANDLDVDEDDESHDDDDGDDDDDDDIFRYECLLEASRGQRGALVMQCWTHLSHTWIRPGRAD